MAVGLETQDSVPHRKDDAKELSEIGGIVCGPNTTADLDVVVVPLQQSFPIEVQGLLCTVRRDPPGSGLSDDATFHPILARALFLPIQRRVSLGKTEYSCTSTSRIQRSRRAAIAPTGLESVSLER
jgi:hypothetical protein